MSELERVKNEVKREFNRRKKTEVGLKLSQVYEDYSRRAGCRNWDVYCAKLKK
jgi:hypothetical protein